MQRSAPTQIVQALCLLAIAAIITPAPIQAQSMIKLFRSKKVDANPDRAYVLSEVEGPWLILAETFTGPTGQERAKQLVMELRKDYDIAAWIHQEKFDFSQPDAAVGVNQPKMRYVNPSSYEAFAVLVGEFDSVDHPDVDKVLKKIKTMNPETFRSVNAESEVGAMSAIRRMHSQLNDLLKAENRQQRGPMFNAFVTRNPLLPESFTQAPEVDSFVRKLNEGVEHSLLKCEGKFTVVVRTFEGLTTMVLGGKTAKDIKPDQDRLDSSMALANKMVTALRKQGVEAYEYHDRTKSLVTIGSFESLGSNGQRGFEYNPEIQRIMKTYCAKPEIGVGPAGNMVSYTNNIKKIPYDVSPYPIAIPKITKRSFYQAAIGK